MKVTFKLPNGKTIQKEFPDSTTREQAIAFLKQEYPKAEEKSDNRSWYEDYLKGVMRLTGNALGQYENMARARDASFGVPIVNQALKWVNAIMPDQAMDQLPSWMDQRGMNPEDIDVQAKSDMDKLFEEAPVAAAAGQVGPYLILPFGVLGRAAGAGVAKLGPKAANLANRMRTSTALDAGLTGGLLGGISSDKDAATEAATGVIAQKLIDPAVRLLSRAPTYLKGSARERVQDAKNMGYFLMPGKRTGDPLLERIDAGITTSGKADEALKSHKSINQQMLDSTVLKSLGKDGSTFYDDTLAGVIDNASDVMEGVAKTNTIEVSEQLVDDLTKLPYKVNVFGDTDLSARAANSIIDTARVEDGKVFITGKNYDDISKQIRSKARGKLMKDADTARRLYGVSNSLDDALEESLGPEARKALQQSRKEYAQAKWLMDKNLIDTGKGEIKPKEFARAYKKLKGVKFGADKSDLGKLAKLVEYENSGLKGSLVSNQNISDIMSSGGFSKMPLIGKMLGIPVPWTNNLLANRYLGDWPAVSGILGPLSLPGTIGSEKTSDIMGYLASRYAISSDE